ncbi:hypothetical protein DPMN_193192 [Dreissena polymorpha]|uniref:Uncharacterized protein n=1 Tax=Dreissena polymorpha TaxID=45954 RepID=A0A9D4BDJ6_DREPO|nr:hypothetical protein DPMN_193192 [Dreissena polymorpha]
MRRHVSWQGNCDDMQDGHSDVTSLKKQTGYDAIKDFRKDVTSWLTMFDEIKDCSKYMASSKFA